jgi:hypothetical protein
VEDNMKAQPIEVYLPDTRGVKLARFGSGNRKIGFGVFTYSRLPGHPAERHISHLGLDTLANPNGTCPGSTVMCEAVCYAKRIRDEHGPVASVHEVNSITDQVPPIPDAARLLRIHVSGDFDTVAYIEQWIERLTERPEVVTWAYTRSWRVPALLPSLERLRALPNVQLFASMDRSHADLPPDGWRRAWINGDARTGLVNADTHNAVTFDKISSYTCPEETGRKKDCVECGYCFLGQLNDVTFLEH